MTDIDRKKWIDFSPVRQSIKSLQPRGVEGLDGGFLLGPSGETVPVEAVKGWGIVPDILDKPDTPVDYFRVGNFLYLNDRLKLQLPAELTGRFADNIIWISRGQSLFWDDTQRYYSPLAIYALSTLDLKGKHVLDLGAGDGVMSLTAQKLGAGRVSSVELYERYGQVYERHLRANGFSTDITRFISHDLANAEGIIERMPEEPVDIVVSNIGFYYKGANLRAIELASGIPSVRSYIDGAYFKGDPIHDPKRAEDHLRKHGFTENYREVTFHKAAAYILERP
jgi:hypothetical protein